MVFCCWQIVVRNLTTPIEASLPIRRKLVAGVSATPRTTACPTDGLRRVITATCHYRNGLNSTTRVVCDGQRSIVTYECPVVPRCMYWDTSLRTWSEEGCKTASLALTGNAVSGVRCTCNHLTTFSAVPDVLSEALISMSSPLELPLPESSRSWGLIIALSVIYLSLIVALLVVRCRRTQESFSYLR